MGTECSTTGIPASTIPPTRIPMKTELRDTTTALGLLVLRAGTGGYLLTHGLGKLEMLLGGQAEMFGDPIGLGKELSLVLITLAEFVGSCLVIVGFGTRIAAATIGIGMAVAAFVAHADNPWTMEGGYVLFTSGAAKTWASKEPALLFLIPALTLILTGPGRFSLDAGLFGRHRQAKVA